jgi:hypothetical protein
MSLATLDDVAARSQSPLLAAAATRVHASWSITRRGDILEVGYGSGSHFPQFAALHTTSSFLRLSEGPGCSWGTSIILFPALWIDGRYHQGSHIAVAWMLESPDLLISFSGAISTLRVHGQLRLHPPNPDFIGGSVEVHTFGSVRLDRRPGEAFKPAVLSSMHVSPDRWDAKSAEAGSQSFQLPLQGWIVEPSITARSFGLTGGSSMWKTNAPTVEIALNQSREIAGWKMRSADPNDDNLSLWAAADHVLDAWQYTFAART